MDSEKFIRKTPRRSNYTNIPNILPYRYVKIMFHYDTKKEAIVQGYAVGPGESPVLSPINTDKF
jgi:hypothetical protein